MIVFRIAALILTCLAFVVLTQDLQLFPVAAASLLPRSLQRPTVVPPRVKSSFIETEDGKRLEVWRLPAAEGVPPVPYVGPVFHGNGDSLDGFFFLHQWFSKLGMVSYGFDYRGYGRSSGWPSELGLVRDADAVWDYVITQERAEPSQMVVFGYSIGAAPAARIASLHDVKLLILESAFTDVRQTIREQPLVRFLAAFAWYRLPTSEFVSQLQATDLILAHGQKDTLVLPYHCDKLRERYRGSGSVEKITSVEAGHNDLFFDIRDRLTAAVRRSLAIDETDERAE